MGSWGLASTTESGAYGQREYLALFTEYYQRDLKFFECTRDSLLRCSSAHR
jgi:hypothetical protein